MPYISTDDLAKVVFNEWQMTDEVSVFIPRLRQAIMAFATDEVAPVIRCFYCKHYIEHDKRCGILNHGMKEADFCSRGKRRTPEIVEEAQDILKRLDLKVANDKQ